MRAPAAGTSFLGDVSRPSRPPSVVPSGSVTPFTQISTPSSEPRVGKGSVKSEEVRDTESASKLPALPSGLPKSPRTIPVPEELSARVASSPVALRDARPHSLVESPLPRPADNSSQTALPPGWSSRHSPPVSPLSAGPPPPSWFSSPRTGAASSTGPVAPPIATSTPWRSKVSSSESVTTNPSFSTEEVQQAAKNAVDKVHLRDLVDGKGRFKDHLRKPAEAQTIFEELSAPDETGRFRTLFEETNLFLAEDLDNDDVLDAPTQEVKDARFHVRAKILLRINYIVDGLESLVTRMLQLENENRFWKADHAYSLLGALRSSSSRGLIWDSFRVIQYRCAKAIALIHQRRALHVGTTYPDSIRSTASDFSRNVRASASKRIMIDKWLDNPDVYPNLTPEYQSVVLRRLGKTQGLDSELANKQVPFDQRFSRLPSSLLVTPVAHGASVSMAEDDILSSRSSSAGRVERDLTRAQSMALTEPPSLVKPEESVRLPSSVDTRPRFPHRTSHANPNFSVPPEADDPGRRVQFQDPPHHPKDESASNGPSKERRSSSHWFRGHSVALPESADAQAVHDAVFPPDRPQASSPRPPWRTVSPIASLRDVPPHLPPFHYEQTYQSKEAGGTKTFVYESRSAGSVARGGKVPPASNFPSHQDEGPPKGSPRESPSHSSHREGGGPPRGGPSGPGGPPGGGDGGGNGGNGNGGGTPPHGRSPSGRPPSHPPSGNSGGPPGGEPPYGGPTSSQAAPEYRPTIVIQQTAAPRETGIRLDQKISRDSIPEWNGSLNTILIYLHKMNNLARKNESVARDLGAAAPDRFTGRAERWWQLLDFDTQKMYSLNWWKLYEGIKLQFFTHKFTVSLRTQYDGQRFRQPGHEKELPMDFVDRRLLYHRHITSLPQEPDYEIAAVMHNAPPTWSTVLSLDSIRTIAALMSRVADKTDELIAFASMAPVRTTQYEQLLRLPSSKTEPRNFSSSRRAFAADGVWTGANFDHDDDVNSTPEPLAASEHTAPALSSDQSAREALALNSQPRKSSTRPPRGAGRKPPAAGYRFPRNDSVKSKKAPPGDCRVCGSPYHWDRDCPHWNEYDVSRRALLIGPEYDCDELENEEYEEAFVAYICSNLSNARLSSASRVNALRAEGEELQAKMNQQRTSKVECEDVDETPSRPLHPLSPDLPHIMERIEPDSPVHVDFLSDMLAEALSVDGSSHYDGPQKRFASTAAVADDTHVPTPHVPLQSRDPLVVPLARIRDPPAGHSTVGVSALSFTLRLGSLSHPTVDCRADSGADISLISQEYLESLPAASRPKVKQGLKMNLFQLTGGFRISGYIQTQVYIESEQGHVLKMTAECYVVPGMSAPLLLGEDFHVNYELSVTRSVAEGSAIRVGDTGYTIPASSSVKRDRPGLKVIVKAADSKFVRAKTHRRHRANRYRELLKSKRPSALAAQDVRIAPHSCRPVPIRPPLGTQSQWFVEKTVLGQSDGTFLLTTPTLVDSSHLYVPVTNPTDRPYMIREGEVLGPLHTPETYFAASDPDLFAHAQTVQTLIRGSVESRPSEESSTTKETSTEDQWGPKTAELPDWENYPSSEMEKLLDIGPEWPPEQRERLVSMLQSNQAAFAFDGRLGQNPTEVEIKLQADSKPISLPMYSASPAKREVIDKQHEAWLNLDVIEPSNSPWGAPVLIAYRNGKPRLCVDYRRLNAVTIPDEFPIPRQNEILQALSGAQVLTSLDALSGFTQLMVADSDREKTAFRTHRGLYQFKRLPFGLRNGPSAFQRVMQGVLAPYLWIFSLVYIDDIVVYSRSWDEHVEHLDKVLKAIIVSGITLSPTKCHFGYTSILLLGQKVSRLGFSTHHEKVRAVTELARPHRVSDLQTFLGMTVYFSSYIPYYSFIVSPLFELLKKDHKWSWTAECESAWRRAKDVLQSAPVLAHAMAGLPYRLYTDASDIALGACLQQVQPIKAGDLKGTRAYDRLSKAHAEDTPIPNLITKVSHKFDDTPTPGQWSSTLDETTVYVERVIAYWSRSCKPAERNYSATEREALAAKDGLVRFQPFIEGERVTLVTDHAALQWARTYENTNRRLAAWGAVFAAYLPNLDIVHRAGRVHSNVDPLSRLPREPPAHDSPISDPSVPIVTDQVKPAAVEQAAERAPARKLAATVSTIASWEDILDGSPAWGLFGVQPNDDSGLIVGGACSRNDKDTQSTIDTPICSRNLSHDEAQANPDEGEEPSLELANKQAAPVSTRFKDQRRPPVAPKTKVRKGSAAEEQVKESPDVPGVDPSTLYEHEGNPMPPAVLIELSSEYRDKFVKGYSKDAFFKTKWRKASEPGLKKFAGQCFFTDQSGLLYMRTGSDPVRLCVPRSEVFPLIARIHDTPYEAAHEGPAKLALRINSRFFWPSLRRDVKDYVMSCDVCQKTKSDHRAKAGFLRPNPVPDRPFEWISFDLITGLPPSDGFDAAFVVVDRCSKFGLFIPCKGTMNTVEFAHLFILQVIFRFGIPDHIISDRDGRWTSEFWRSVAAELNVHLCLSSSHHPQHDGQTEIVNQRLETMLRAYVQGDRQGWARWLPALAHTYNSSIHSATGYSPYFLLYGFDPKGTTDFLGGTNRYEQRPLLVSERATEFVMNMELHRQRARDALAMAQEQAARQYNEGRRPETFPAGSRVLVNPHSLELVDVKGTGKKLVQRMLGPFTVLEQVNPLVYRLAMPDTYPMNPVINIEHLRKYHEPILSSREVRRPILPDPRNSELLASEEYEVEQIVAWRRNKSRSNRLEFLVRWKGYSPIFDTWEPASHLQNAYEILREYKATHKLSR
ncbi:hypothetical protein EVJ58_g8762 [Rhodofomes roseus]|uniref:Reverse transcriptase domain-containing protein n=1 Tax=Rhodofomes roseus TaxID=34475 RepID=A0A4Y9XWZ7_9APHY|nr:hypothetical protein EVJ58_g8762 [Rhodofomes roseus]